MQKEKYLFKYHRSNATSKITKRKNMNSSLCSRYLSSTNLSLSIQNKSIVPFPEISKTQAKLSYISTYKNLDKIIDKVKHNKTEPSPVSSYLSKIKANGLVPGTIGLLNRSDHILDISHYSIGNAYADALSEGIKKIQVNRAIFKNNRLTDQGASELVSNINPRHLVELNLAENTIGIQTVSIICTILELEYSKLRILNLESNKIEERALILMCSVIAVSDKLSEFSLGNNNIGEYGASALSKYVKVTHSLEKLDLHWNCIKGEGARQFFEALCDNNSIKVLDLSWNALNSPLGGSPIKSLAKAIKQNTKIYHLDLSNNSFTEPDCQVLAEALTFNTTLIGLHMEGNGAKVNNKGFLQLDITSSRARNLHIYKHLMSKKKRKDPNCWICQRWNEVTWVMKTKESYQKLFFHLELFDFEGEEIEKIAEKSFRVSKICPPGLLKFFFSDGVKQVLSNEFSVGKFEQEIIVGEIIAEEFNYLVNKECNSILWKEYYPRAYPRQCLYSNDEGSWRVKNSVFRDYVLDSPKLIDQCFDSDLSMTSFLAIITEPKDHISRLLKQSYQLIKDLHKHLYSICKNLWKSWQEQILEILSVRNIIDNNHLKASDLNLLLKQVKSSDTEIPNELARFQFLELLIRASLMRYYRTGIVSQYDSIENILKELSHLNISLNTDDFRSKKYINYSVDKAIKKHLNWFVSTFAIYEKESFIRFKEFVKIVSVYSKNEEFALKCCYLAKETKRYGKYFEPVLRFSEFLEAFCRFLDGERVDQDLKRLNLDVLVDIVVNDYFKNAKINLLRKFK